MWSPKKILCPTDFSEGSERAILQASEMARPFGAAIYLLHVIPVLTVLPTDPVHSLSLVQAHESLRIQFEQYLKESAEKLQAAGVTARTLIAFGDAAAAIVQTAEEKQADLVVIATYGKTGWRRLAFGSVTEKVVRLATCPVLTIRSTPAGTTAGGEHADSDAAPVPDGKRFNSDECTHFGIRFCQK
jgi:nucleotide-binding universal stress UspA family protein